MAVQENEGHSGHPLTWQQQTHWASPMLTCKGGISVGMSPPWSWGTGEEASACLPVGCKTIAVSTHLCLLGGGGPTNMEGSGWVMAPHRMSYRPLASDLATANSTCWRSLISRGCASNHRKLA